MSVGVTQFVKLGHGRSRKPTWVASGYFLHSLKYLTLSPSQHVLTWIGCPSPLIPEGSTIRGQWPHDKTMWLASFRKNYPNSTGGTWGGVSPKLLLRIQGSYRA